MIVRSRAGRISMLALTLALLLGGCGRGRTDPLPYIDSFYDPESGWGAEQTGATERGYEDGAYVFTLRRQNWLVWANPGQTFEDVRIEADVRAGLGAETALAGVMCRYSDPDNFYFFAITADGYYGISRRVDGEDLEILTGHGTLVSSDHILLGDAVNRVEVVCQGERLSLSVNGTLLASVIDSQHARGDVGIGAGSGATGQACVAFDEIVVTHPLGELNTEQGGE